MAVHAKQGPCSMDIHGYPWISMHIHYQVSDPVIQVPDPIFWQVSDPGPSFRSKFLIPPLPNPPPHDFNAIHEMSLGLAPGPGTWQGPRT